MEEKLQQEKQGSEHKHSNEDQGGIRHRLRDRNLLRKRKVEAEEKETNQVESQRKKHRAESSTKRRGRPKKSEPMPEISIIQEEAAVSQEVPVVVVPEPTEVIPDQTPGSLSPLLAVESQPSPVPDAAAPRPLFGSIQSSNFAPTLTSPAPVKTTTAIFSPSAPVPFPVKVLDTTPVLVLDSAPAPDAVPVLAQALVPTAAPAPAAAPLQVETIFTEAQCREALDQVLIKDLGPEEEGDISSSQDKRANEDLIGTSSYNIPDQNKMLSTLSLTPPPQKYFPGNLF